MASPRAHSKSPNNGGKAGRTTTKAASCGKAHPSTMDIIQEALRKTEEKNGLSFHSIKTYAKSAYPDLAVKSGFKTRVKNALLKGLESEVLKRPKRCATYTGAHGFFKLADTKRAKLSATTKPRKPRSKSRSLSPGRRVTKKLAKSKSPAKKGGAAGKAKPAKKATAGDKSGKPATKRVGAADRSKPAKKVAKPRSRSRSPATGKAKVGAAKKIKKPKTASPSKKAGVKKSGKKSLTPKKSPASKVMAAKKPKAKVAKKSS